MYSNLKLTLISVNQLTQLNIFQSINYWIYRSEDKFYVIYDFKIFTSTERAWFIMEKNSDGRFGWKYIAAIHTCATPITPYDFQIAIPVSKIFLKKGSGAKRDSGR